MIPRAIYTYWDQAPLPPLVQHCMRSWRQHDPDARIVLFDKQRAMQQLSPPVWFERMPAQNQSDWVRLKMLAEHGGVWLDATTFLFQSTAAWASAPDALTVFFIDGELRWLQNAYRHMGGRGSCKGFDQIENWAIASPARHDFVLEWLRQYEMAWDLGHEAYVARLRREGLYPECFIHPLPYFNQHLAATVVYENKLYRQPVHRLSFCQAMHCSTARFVEFAYKPAPPEMWFFKMTGGHRKALRFISACGLYTPDSLHATIFDMPANPWPGRASFLATCLLVVVLLKIAILQTRQ